MWRAEIYYGDELVFHKEYERFDLAMHRGRQELALWQDIKDEEEAALEVVWEDEDA